MSKTGQDSLHDFFENRTSLENGVPLDRSDDDNGRAANTPNPTDIEAKSCTSNNDLLIEGYVLINMIDGDKTLLSSSNNSKSVKSSTIKSMDDTKNSQSLTIKEKEYSEDITLSSDNAMFQNKDYSLRLVKSDRMTNLQPETSDTQSCATSKYDIVFEPNKEHFTREKVGHKMLRNMVSSTSKDEYFYDHATQDMSDNGECCDDSGAPTKFLNSSCDNEDKGLGIGKVDEYCSDCDTIIDSSSTCKNDGDDNDEVTDAVSNNTRCDENSKSTETTTRNKGSDDEIISQDIEVNDCSDTIISTILDELNGQRMRGIDKKCDMDDLAITIESSTKYIQNKDGDMTVADKCFNADKRFKPESPSRQDDDKDHSKADITEGYRDCSKRKKTRSTCHTDQDSDDDEISDNRSHVGHDADANKLSIKHEKSTKNAEGTLSEDVVLIDSKPFSNRCEKDERDDTRAKDVVDGGIIPYLSGKNETAIRMARAIKEVKTVSLSRRTKECPDLWIPFSDEGLFERPCNKAKPDTPYPSQVPVLSLNVPSGVFGDSLRPPGTYCDDILPYTDTPMTTDNVSRLNRCSAELNCTPAFTEKLSDTPRYSSAIKEICMRPLSGTMTSISNSSGRKNPLAKVDSEVRDIERAARAHVFQGTQVAVRSARKPLPPIHSAVSKDSSTVCRTRELTGKKNVRHLLDTIPTANTARAKRKPAVPRVLRSSVCYQEGKVDVSIYSDGRVLSRSDPFHLNINFVRQPLRIVTPTGSANSKPVGQPKEEHVSKRLTNDVKESKVGRQLRPALNTKTYKHLGKKPRNGLLPITNPPKLKVNTARKPQNLSTETAKSRKASNRSEDIQEKARANIWYQSCDSLDWNIVERRAQKPPFNTHTDPEASYRHRQFFMDY